MIRAYVAAALFSCHPAWPAVQAHYSARQPGDAGEQCRAAPGARPFRAVTARHVRTALLAVVRLVEQLVPAALAAVPGHLAHLRRPPHPGARAARVAEGVTARSRAITMLARFAARTLDLPRCVLSCAPGSFSGP